VVELSRRPRLKAVPDADRAGHGECPHRPVGPSAENASPVNPIAGLLQGRSSTGGAWRSEQALMAPDTAVAGSQVDLLRRLVGPAEEPAVAARERFDLARLTGPIVRMPTARAQDPCDATVRSQVIRRIPDGDTKESKVRVLVGPYANAVGTLLNWYPGSRQYEVDFGEPPGPTLRDVEFFSPETLEYADDLQPATASAKSKEESDDTSGSSASTEEPSPEQPARYRPGQWLVLIKKGLNGMPQGTRFQVDYCVETEERVEVREDDGEHPYGGSYGYDYVEPVAERPPGNVTSLTPPAQPANLPELGDSKGGNLPFLDHPNYKMMVAAMESHGFVIAFDKTTADQQTQVVRFQEPGRSAIGKRIVEIGPTTTYSDVEHEFTHVRQQTRWSKTSDVGYLPTKTHQVEAGTLAEGRANPGDREMDNHVERSLGEVEAYGEELIRLFRRKELKTGNLSLADLARDRFLRWLGDYLGLTNGDPAKAKGNFTLANDQHRLLFPDVEPTVRTALKIAGELLGNDFKVPTEIIDRRG
jgi:hypothetical protein